MTTKTKKQTRTETAMAMLQRGEIKRIIALLERKDLDQAQVVLLQDEAIDLIVWEMTVETKLSLQVRVEMLCELILRGPDLDPVPIDILMGSWHLHDNPVYREAVLDALAPQLVARELNPIEKETQDV